MTTLIKGIEKIDYINKAGNQVDAVRFHVQRKDPNVIGECVEAIYVSTNALKNLGIVIPDGKMSECLGKTLEVEYNSRGFLVGLQISEEIEKTA